MDLKDFFMSGSSEFLVQHCGLLVKAKWRKTFKTALRFILENQFITATLFPSHFWRVICGSGMGLRSSASVANSAFFHAVELMGLMLCRRQHALESYAIKHYFRYFDNLFFICSCDFRKIRKLVHDVEHAIGPFKGSVEEASHVGIDFLDLFLFKDRRTSISGKLSFAPHLKPTALSSTLSLYSAHPSGVHEAWMRSYVLRIRNRCSSLTWFNTFKQEVLSRLRKSGMDHAIVDRIDETTVCTERIDLPIALRPARSSERSVRSSIWIKIPYHPLWYRELNASLRTFSSDHRTALREFVPEFDDIRIAWQLRMPALGSVVKRI